eukprot:13843349-Alexandrium_andersonii.AAC.1
MRRRLGNPVPTSPSSGLLLRAPLPSRQFNCGVRIASQQGGSGCTGRAPCRVLVAGSLHTTLRFRAH